MPMQNLSWKTANISAAPEIEKMSKSKYNTVNPDVLVDKYGADTFRMYQMFLGPVEQSDSSRKSRAWKACIASLKNYGGFSLMK